MDSRRTFHHMPGNIISANDPAGIKVKICRSCLKIGETLDLGLTGVLAGISLVLASNKVSIFAISYDTDYILIKYNNSGNIVKALEEGYEIQNKKLYRVNLEN